MAEECNPLSAVKDQVGAFDLFKPTRMEDDVRDTVKMARMVDGSLDGSRALVKTLDGITSDKVHNGAIDCALEVGKAASIGNLGTLQPITYLGDVHQPAEGKDLESAVHSDDNNSGNYGPRQVDLSDPLAGGGERNGGHNQQPVMCIDQGLQGWNSSDDRTAKTARVGIKTWSRRARKEVEGGETVGSGAGSKRGFIELGSGMDNTANAKQSSVLEGVSLAVVSSSKKPKAVGMNFPPLDL